MGVWRFTDLGFRVLGFGGLGFWGLGLRVLGFKGFGFKGLAFRFFKLMPLKRAIYGCMEFQTLLIHTHTHKMCPGFLPSLAAPDGNRGQRTEGLCQRCRCDGCGRVHGSRVTPSNPYRALQQVV